MGYFLTLLLCFLASVTITPLVKKLAFIVGATDRPNQRKVHQKIMPRLGGLAIYIAFMVGVLVLDPDNAVEMHILLGSAIIIITGMLGRFNRTLPESQAGRPAVSRVCRGRVWWNSSRVH